MILQYLSLMTIVFFISSCAFFGPSRSYVDEMDQENEGLFRPGGNFQITQGDKNSAGRDRQQILERTPLMGKNKDERELDKNLNNELVELEENLSEEEYKNYLNSRSVLPTLSEKIYYLRLESMQDRNNFIASHEKAFKKKGLSSWEEEQAIRSREIYVGMNKNTVIRSWGRPLRVDIAGNPGLENERWAFYDSGVYRYVFFESGKVKGWSDNY